MAYKTTIGLEIHSELKTKTKMFCDCLNDPKETKPNVNICPICMGHPGTLPVINMAAVSKVVKTGLALGCDIPEYSKFDRKNYFYPDLPKGYQISQYDKPFCLKGCLEIEGKKIGITRVHLEEDTGRLIHPQNEDYSLVDFNRAGVPLMELVTEPDIKSAQEARKFAEELQLILRYLGVSSADMEKGQMRVEVNISLNKGEKKLGTKVEIKNLNSFRSVEKGIEFEIKRQEEVLESGKKVIQETRGWDDNKGITVSQREKEEAQDYRYLPEPDLPVHHFKTNELINKIKAEIPELPRQKRGRFKKEYGIEEKSIEIFVQNREFGEYFEKVMSEFLCWLKDEGEKEPSQEKFFKVAKFCANYLITDLQGLLSGDKIDDKDFIITPENFAEYITLIYEGKISSKIAKMVLAEMYKTGADPSHVIEEKDWAQIDDQAEIEKIIQDVISKNSKATDDFRKGKENAFQFLVGQIMAQSRGKANPEMVRSALKEILTKK
ncbi:MAG: Asp-tRNA(Asn)/Glu-tRNA(Gln) amidotransferase subunit GatB [Candidatus Nealsonbacteria bacterium]|nr:Asp-tRNA(Asn)/Glu-tRNA(Gln) amidotransferase subunit GatB [Candidatus Nealsonbacteria bacterium]